MFQFSSPPFTKVKRTTLSKLWPYRPLSLWWSCGPIDVLPLELLGSLLFCAPVGTFRCLPVSVALLSVLGEALLVLSWCLLCGWRLSLLFVGFPPPAVSSLLRLLVPPSGYLVAAVTAQLPCFVLGVWLCSVIPPSNVSWQQRLRALCGVFTLYTMLQMMSGSLAWPRWGIHRMMIQAPHWTPLSCPIAILMWLVQPSPPLFSSATPAPSSWLLVVWSACPGLFLFGRPFLFASLVGLLCPPLLVYPPLLSVRYERMELSVECMNIVDLFDSVCLL